MNLLLISTGSVLFEKKKWVYGYHDTRASSPAECGLKCKEHQEERFTGVFSFGIKGSSKCYPDECDCQCTSYRRPLTMRYDYSFNVYKTREGESMVQIAEYENIISSGS